MSRILRDSPVPLFFLAFAAIGAAFLGSTLYAETRYSAIDRDAWEIAANAMPSVQHLVGARGALRHIEVAAERLARSTGDARATARQALIDARTELHAEVSAELETPDYPGEQAAATTAQRDVADLDAKLDGWVAAPPNEGDAADEAIHASVDRVDAALMVWLSLNARHGREGIGRIIEVRRNSMGIALGLDAACLALALAAAVVALQALGRRREAEAQNARLLVERADELETFAKRVAHDLLSPLSALVFCLHAFKSAAASDPPLGNALARARACVARAQTMVDGIFEFARAGAHPAALGRADVRQVVDEVTDEIHDLEPSTELIVEPFPNAEVVCSAGVLLSILSNLVRNAVKYMSDSAMKRVTVRVTQDAASLRVEVEDTGPGVPEGMGERIFDAYVRAEGVTQPGLGLGLATVKRLCEAHGGTVGVRSAVGRGSVFWFTLPAVRAAGGSVRPPRGATAPSVS